MHDDAPRSRRSAPRRTTLEDLNLKHAAGAAIIKPLWFAEHPQRAYTMKKTLVIIGSLLILKALGLAAAAEENCDRACLGSLMDQYLAALAARNPSSVPLAPDVRLVENTESIPVGKGLWETATAGPKDFKIYVPDPVAGQIGFLGVIQENDKPALLAARLRVVNRRITEIDHLVVHDVRQPLPAALEKPRPALLQPIAKSERVPRELMVKAAMAYYDAIEQDDGKVAPFSPECERHENGTVTLNAGTRPDPAAAKENPMIIFRHMTCSDQLSTGYMSYITGIDQRRLIAVDDESGLVFIYSMFNHTGEPKVLKIVGVPGITERANTWGAFSLPAAHIFKIRNGRIHEIEAIGYRADYGIKNGW